jgi:hypothetical protein
MKALARLDRRISEMQAKTRSDLRAMVQAQQALNQQLLGIIARGQGIELPPLPDVGELFGDDDGQVGGAGPAVMIDAPAAAAPAAAPAAEPVAEPAGAKNDALAALREVIREEMARMAGATGAQPAAATLAAAPPDLLATDVYHPGSEQATAIVLGQLASNAPPPITPAKTWRAAVDPSTPGNGTQAKAITPDDLVWSTTLGCAIPRADRDNCQALMRPGREGQRR